MGGPYRSGSQAQIVLGNENGLNTMWGTPVGTVFRKSRFTCSGAHTLIDDNELRSDPNPPKQEKGMDESSASLVVPVTTEEMGFFLYWFLGDYSVAGVGDPYTHTFKIDTTAPISLWLEVGDLELGKYDLFNGLLINSLSFGEITKANNMLMLTVGFATSGLYTKNNAAPEDAAPTSYSVNKHTHPGVSLKVDNTTTALLTKTSYTISRNITYQGFLNGTAYMSDFDSGDYAYDFTTGGYREAADTIFGYDDDAEHGVEILAPRAGDATHWVSLDHNECFIYDSEQQGETSDDGPTPATVRVKPTYINHGDGSSIVATVVTEIADYSALMASS